MPYRFYVPENYDSTKLYPIVLAMHTSDRLGKDNEKHLMEGYVATIWVDSANQANHPCFVVAPQLPYAVSNFETHIFDSVIIEIIDNIISSYSIDTNRQYITGISLGGGYAWGLPAAYPGRFAAAIPMSGAPNLSKNTKNCKNVSVWAFHGQVDDVVNVNNTRRMIEEQIEQGRKVVFTKQYYRKKINLTDKEMMSQINSHSDILYSEIRGWSHFIWDPSYKNPMLIEWVFNQYRHLQDSNAIKIVNFNNYKVLNGIDTLKWESEYSDYNVEIWYSHNDGRYWQEISHNEENSGQYLLNTEDLEDCVAGLIKVLLKDTNDNVLSFSISNHFGINNNSSNGKPYITILDNKITKTDRIDLDSINIEMLVGDPENDELNIEVFYRNNEEEDYFTIESFDVNPNSIFYVSKYVNLKNQDYSEEASIKVVVSDGQNISSDSTASFENGNSYNAPIPESINEQTGMKFKPIIYPNPSRGLFTINIDEPIHKETIIEIYGITGGLVLKNTFQNQTSINIDLTAYAKGLYLLKVIINEKTFNEKVFIK